MEMFHVYQYTIIQYLNEMNKVEIYMNFSLTKLN